MPTLLYRNLGLVKGVAFDSWRRVGGVMQSIKVYNLRQVDELVFLDIAATAEGRPPDFQAIDEFADECFMPMTVGGGVRNLGDVEHLLKVGADKVAVNTAFFGASPLVQEASRQFGAQCIVVSLDVRWQPEGWYVFTHAGTHPTGVDPITAARRAANDGAGELLLTSIERDGTMNGYDLELIRSVSDAVDIPVIASGGAGHYQHMYEAITVGASAVAAASMFHFTQQTPRGAKEYLSRRGVPVRL